MALMESVNVPLGSKMPDFELKDPTGKVYKSEELYGKGGLLVIFSCNHCPYAQAVWGRVIQLARYGRGMRLNAVAINPNIHPDFPDDAPGKMIEKIKALGIDFPYLVDEGQDVARAFKAQCTPDIYLFDQDHRLFYHGRIDDNWKDESRVTREELKEAMNNLAAGKASPKNQMPSMGCSIKWRI